jgi:hypothetical protein
VFDQHLARMIVKLAAHEQIIFLELPGLSGSFRKRAVIIEQLLPRPSPSNPILLPQNYTL